MSTLIIRTLVIGLLLFPIVVLTTNQRDRAAARLNAVAESPSGTTTVEVTFDGLMIFEEVDNHYELGILQCPDHVFGWLVGKPVAEKLRASKAVKQTLVNSLESSDALTLEVLDSSGKPVNENVSRRETKPCHRQGDTLANEDFSHAYDFCWIMDLENDFNGGKPLTLEPGHLKPIIHISQGQLFVKFKYDELEHRRRSSLGFDPYGFAAQTIGLRVELREGEHLVLRNASGKEGFRLPDEKRNLNVAIFNAPTHSYPSLRARTRSHSQDSGSHFTCYWAAFQGSEADKQADIRRKKFGGLRPLNRWANPGPRFQFIEDELRVFTFDDMACGGAFLGVSQDGLK